MELPIDILIVGNILRDDSILLRKKFFGAGPYKETWYSFGCKFVSGKDPVVLFAEYISSTLGISINFKKYLSWDTEIKRDNGNIVKQFVYLYAEFEYGSGTLIFPKGLEKIEFVPFGRLGQLDIVPPSVLLFTKLGYLQA